MNGLYSDKRLQQVARARMESRAEHAPKHAPFRSALAIGETAERGDRCDWAKTAKRGRQSLHPPNSQRVKGFLDRALPSEPPMGFESTTSSGSIGLNSGLLRVLRRPKGGLKAATEKRLSSDTLGTRSTGQIEEVVYGRSIQFLVPRIEVKPSFVLPSVNRLPFEYVKERPDLQVAREIHLRV
jgi:hypothetical protein